MFSDGDVRGLAIASFGILIAVMLIFIGVAAWAYGIPPAIFGG